MLGVCRRLLKRAEDTEDAFQATFLALARKAGSVARRDAVASWLYKVAYRIALDARTLSARLDAREKLVPFLPAVASQQDVSQQVARSELQSLVDAAIQRLPRKYRDPVVLCYFEGRTQEEAAQELGWAKGTVSTRLIHARELLRRRLQRHAEPLAPTVLLPPLAHEGLPPGLVKPTMRAVLAFQTPTAASGVVSTKAIVLAEGVLRAMAAASHWKLTVLVLLVASLCSAAGWLGYQVTRAEPAHEGGQVAPRVPGANGERVVDAQLPSLLGKLDPGQIPLEDRFAWQPKELVAVLGEHRGRHWGSVQAVAVSPDGKQIASCGDDLAIRLWDAATLHEQVVLKEHTQRVRHVAFSPNGKTLASGGDDHKLVLWDLTMVPPKARAVFKLSAWVPALAFSGDGSTLAAAEGDVRAPIRLWKMAGEKGPQPLAPLFGPQKGVNSLAFSGDGKTLASGSSSDGTVLLWDLPTRKEIAQLQTKAQQLVGLSFSPDGKRLACVANYLKAGGNAVFLWDVTDRAKLRVKDILNKYTDQIHTVTFSPDGNTLATGSGGTVDLWDLAGAAPSEKAVIPTGRSVSSLDFSADATTLVTGHWSGMIRSWDLTKAGPQERFTHHGHVAAVNALSLARNGLVASGSHDGTARLWDLSGTQAEERSPLSGEGSTSPLALSRDGKTLALESGYGGNLEVWDLSAEKPRKRLRCQPHNSGQMFGMTCLELSADGRTLVSCGVDNIVRFWDLTKDKPTVASQLKLHGSYFRLPPSRKGNWPIIAVYGPEFAGANPALWKPGTTVRVWDLTESKPKEQAILEHSMDVISVAFTPDGQTVATAAGKRIVNRNPTPGEVRLWRLSNIGPRTGYMLLVGATDQINDVTFSPDGQTLAAAGWRGQVILWESATGKKCREWQLPGSVNQLAFTGYGRHLITANGNGTLYVFRLGLGVAAATNVSVAWETLASADTSAAYRTIWSLVAAPHQALALFKDHLQPAQAVPSRQIQELLDQLDDDRFEVREKARAALEKLQDQPETALRRRLTERPSAEVRRQIEQLLAELHRPISLDRLRTLRAIQVLEQIGNRDAQQLLRRLAQGAPEAMETLQARAALQRLAERSAPLP